jgi:hypothetical protein
MSKNDQLPVVTHNQNAGKIARASDTSETRFNALKHGLTSEGICEVDDMRSHKLLCRQLKRQYEPCGAVEEFLVQHIGLCITRIRSLLKKSLPVLRRNVVRSRDARRRSAAANGDVQLRGVGRSHSS